MAGIKKKFFIYHYAKAVNFLNFKFYITSSLIKYDL